VPPTQKTARLVGWRPHPVTNGIISRNGQVKLREAKAYVRSAVETTPGEVVRRHADLSR